MEAKQEAINHLKAENGCRVYYLVRPTAESTKPCEVDCSSLLNDDDRKLWLSSKRQPVFPFILIVDLTQSVFQSK